METRIVIACGLALVIDLIGTLAYSVRIVGVRTHRIALSYALFNILVLVGRTANAFQGPLVAKSVETNTILGTSSSLLLSLRLVLVSATVATIIGALLIPSFQRLLSIAVLSYSKNGSVARLLLRASTTAGRKQIGKSIRIPSRRNLQSMFSRKGAPAKVILANVCVVAFGSCGTLAALYAGSLDPSLRTTAVSLTATVNGLATLLLYLFVDPYLANLTDKVASGQKDERFFRRCVTQMVGARAIGTVFGQILLVPGAIAIATMAKLL
jgi:hypothetical protein